MAPLASFVNTSDKSWVGALTCVVWTLFTLINSRYSTLSTLLHVPFVWVLAWLVCRATYGIAPPSLTSRILTDGNNHSILAKIFRGAGLHMSKPHSRFKLVAHPVNHYGEKVRWIMDLLSIDYEECNVGGGMIFTLRSRSVPWLIDTKASSQINDSDEIIFYLGAVLVPKMAADVRPRAEAFLKRSPESIEWEEKLNHMGHWQQGFIYFYMHNPANGFPADAIKLLWGQSEPHVPYLDRLLSKLLWPVLLQWVPTIGLDCSEESQKTREKRILGMFDEVDAALAKSCGKYIMGDSLTYIDITFVGLWGPWLPATTLSTVPVQFAKGRFTSYEKFLDKVQWPGALAQFEKDLMSRPCGQFIKRLYAELRTSTL